MGVKSLGDMLTAGLMGLHREILLFAIVGLAIGGLDDLLVDLLFLLRRGWRDMTVYRRHPRMTTATLPPSPSPGRIAIFIPAWREADVIGAMLRHALACWPNDDFQIFLGVYPNDPDTLDVIFPVATDEPRILVAINPRPGPTTKADCLNVLWRAMLDAEARSGQLFKAVLLHDAEQVGTVVFSRIRRNLRISPYPPLQICAVA